MSKLTPLPLALHVFGVISWISGIMATALLLYAAERETGEPRARLLALAKMRAIGMEIGATLAIGFGLYWLFKYDLYKQPYMHIKLTLVLVLLGLHGLLRAKIKRMPEGAAGLPKWFTPATILTGLAIIVIVFLKVPFKS
jgi:putative membrane protein